MSFRILFPVVAAVLLMAGSPLSAQLDPEPKTPYLWRVVLKVQPHPLLSPTFRQQLKRDLEAALQSDLGALGVVEVIDLTDSPRDKWDPLWQQFDDKGFSALEAPRDLTGAKTHFLKLEYRDGLYLLEARQHDGFAGLSSGYAGWGAPIIRKQTVWSPEMVGRTAGLMLDRDFGLVGTVEPMIGNNKEVKVIVRGGQLGPVDRFVKVGDVFAVSEVFKTNRAAPPPNRTATGKIIAPPPGSVPPPGLSARLRSNCLLKVLEVGADGSLRCDALNRTFQVGPGGIAALRCMKLGTIDGPLTIRLMSGDGKSAKMAAALAGGVRATEKGFDAPDDARDTLGFRDGLFRSGRPLNNLACITVTIGPTDKKRFLVPILGSDPVNLTVEIDPRAEEKAMFERAALALISRSSDAKLAQDVCFAATEKLLDKQKNSEALARARSGFQAADAAKTSILDELAHLRQSEDKSPSGKRLLTIVEQNLKTLEQVSKQLDTVVKQLEVVVARETDPTSVAREVEAQSLSARIAILLGRGDVDEALSAYDQLALLLPGEAAEVKARQAKLRAEWKPKNDVHAKAREYLLKTWPAIATIPDFKDSQLEFVKDIEECKKQGDHYTLRKLKVMIRGAQAKLDELSNALDSNSDTDRKLQADVITVNDLMHKQELEIDEFIKKGGQ